MAGNARKALAEAFLLGGHSHGAVVGVANPRHNAAFCNHSDRPEAKFFCTHEGCHHYIPAGFQSAVSAEDHPIAELVFQEGAMDFRESQLPGTARVFDGTEGRGTGTPIVARDLNHIRVGFGHSRCDRPNTHFRH